MRFGAVVRIRKTRGAVRCGAVFRNRKTYGAVLGAVFPYRKTYVARCGCKLMLTRSFYPSTSSTPTQCPCRFFLLDTRGAVLRRAKILRCGAVRLTAPNRTEPLMLCIIATMQSDVVTGQAPITMEDLSRKKCDVFVHTIL